MSYAQVYAESYYLRSGQSRRERWLFCPVCHLVLFLWQPIVWYFWNISGLIFPKLNIFTHWLSFNGTIFRTNTLCLSILFCYYYNIMINNKVKCIIIRLKWHTYMLRIIFQITFLSYGVIYHQNTCEWTILLIF